MRKSNFYRLALAFGLAVAIGAPGVGYAAGERGGDSADVSKFKDQIQKDTNLSQQDISAIEPQLREFSQKNVEPDKVSDLTKTAVQNNCTGPCLRDVLSSMNNAMSKGLSSDDAHSMVSQTLRDQVQARGGTISDPSELGSQVRASVDAQLSGTPGADTGTMGGGATGGMSGGTTGGTTGGADTGYGR